MADWTTRISESLGSNPGYAEFFILDVRERIGREVSHQEILEAIKATKKHPLPWREYHGKQIRWTTAKPVEAVIRYLQNPDKYHHEVQKRQRERLQEDPLQRQKQKRKTQQELLEQLESQTDKLAHDQKWEEVAKVCRRWLELSPNSAKAMYRLASAHYNLDRLEEAEELCKTIRSSFRLQQSDLDAIESLLHEVSAKKGQTLESVYPPGILPREQLLGVESGNLPDAQLVNRLLAPDYVAKETWINHQRLIEIVQALTERDRTCDVPKLEQFSRQCWAEIKSKRRYQVPSQGRAEILASEMLSDLMDLRLVRIVQEGASAPEVFIRFGFGEPCAIGIATVKEDGSTEGFHVSAGSDLFRAVIEATALAYYRDLVVPTRVYHPRTESDTPQVRAPVSNQTREPLPTQTASAPQHQTHKLPRTQVVSHSSQRTYRLEEWYQAQERARHEVVGHVRWIGQHFRADPLKVQQAREAGVELQPGYTWVIEHERGGRRSDELRLSGLDLVERTWFLPPEQASRELDRLLS